MLCHLSDSTPVHFQYKCSSLYPFRDISRPVLFSVHYDKPQSIKPALPVSMTLTRAAQAIKLLPHVHRLQAEVLDEVVVVVVSQNLHFRFDQSVWICYPATSSNIALQSVIST